MADLVMPRLPDQQQAWFHHPHHHQPTGHQRSFSYHMSQQQQPQQQQIQQQAQSQRQSPPGFSNSSDISPLSTSNSTSPVSPKNYHGRQVRPLYMPAVLRPNEYPSSPALPKGSPAGEEVDDDERVVRSSGSFTSLSGILSLSRLSRRSTGDSGKVVDWDWDLSNYPKVDGQPTRRHWKVRAHNHTAQTQKHLRSPTILRGKKRGGTAPDKAQQCLSLRGGVTHPTLKRYSRPKFPLHLCAGEQGDGQAS